MKLISTIIIILIITTAGCTTARHRGDAIRERIAKTSELSTHNITIEEDVPGIVTLRGNVSSSNDRETIEEIARNTSGVREVRNNLIVAPSSVAVREGYPSPRDQRGLVSEITSRLSASPDLRDYRLQVVTIEDVVTLRGEVSRDSERRAAEDIARATPGVARVRNEILIAPSARSDYQLSRDVREALERQTSLDLRRVEITTNNSVVTLRGLQNSNREIDQLVASARMVPGVREVRNELNITSGTYSGRYRQR